MRKRLFCLFAAVLLLSALCGCGGSSVGVIGGADGPTQITVGGPGTENNAAEEQAPPPEPETAYVFVYKGVTIATDAPAAPILEALGDPLSSFEAPSCAFEGLDKTYTYPGFELDTYPMDGVDYVSAVILKDDSITTPEGLMIGSPVADIESAYGEPTFTSLNLMVYERGGVRLRFILNGQDVISIEYLSPATDTAE